MKAAVELIGELVPPLCNVAMPAQAEAPARPKAGGLVLNASGLGNAACGLSEPFASNRQVLWPGKAGSSAAPLGQTGVLRPGRARSAGKRPSSRGQPLLPGLSSTSNPPPHLLQPASAAASTAACANGAAAGTRRCRTRVCERSVRLAAGLPPELWHRPCLLQPRPATGALQPRRCVDGAGVAAPGRYLHPAAAPAPAALCPLSTPPGVHGAALALQPFPLQACTLS